MIPPVFMPHIQETLLWNSPNHLRLSLRAYHPVSGHFPVDFRFSKDSRKVVNHISAFFQRRIQFALCRFRSLLFTASLLVSFPAGTKTLQFPAFPILADELTKSYDSHSDIPGSMATCASPGQFRSLSRPSSAVEPSHPPDSV